MTEVQQFKRSEVQTTMCECGSNDVIVSAQGESCGYCGKWLKGPYTKISATKIKEEDDAILAHRREMKPRWNVKDPREESW